ncbi:dual oxidase maturation factor 1-like [Chelonus insularis]|uniref:dual oxidase maturation factor 1-like n=1 Tax=Chelonus insularis TaxID=460826 RepID=UPI00158B0261|nr:dual oxidase maturation factor 1-like [Chelonus insularis]
MSWLFQYGRSEKFPTIYESKKTWVTIDYDEVIIFFIFSTLAIIFLSIVPGYGKRSLHVGIKAFFSISIGFSLFLVNYGQEWEVGQIETSTPYRAGEKSEIQAQIKIKIGLRSINITLKGFGERGTPLEKEIINYNERFSWTWDQGTFGFGPSAGLLQRSLREAQRKGLPIPIIWIVDLLSIDGEGIRFGRYYRTTGWYCHILLWAAVPAWILANIFLQSVGRYAAYFTGLIGILEITSCIIWMNVRNPNPLAIHFNDKLIEMHYGPTFWLAATTGILCLLLSLILLILDLRHPNLLAIFLGIDILNQYDEFLIRATELDHTKDKCKKYETIELGKKKSDENLESDAAVILLKRRTAIKCAQKDFLRKPTLSMTFHNIDNERPEYVNQYGPGPSFPDGKKDVLRPQIPKRK